MCGILAAVPVCELPPSSAAQLCPRRSLSPVGNELVSHHYDQKMSFSPIPVPISLPALCSSPSFLCSPPTGRTRGSLCHSGPCPLATTWGQRHLFCPFAASGPGQHRQLTAGLGLAQEQSSGDQV